MMKTKDLTQDKIYQKLNIKKVILSNKSLFVISDQIISVKPNLILSDMTF